ncbi:sugar transferase [Sphingomonas arenae]|uniref:sugar transferase n=1 Tax=Sphingomonas arenae TaxID=2812555 RepID=UPI001966F162|nr:sugar transferase [Sphingomonas arenae]
MLNPTPRRMLKAGGWLIRRRVQVLSSLLIAVLIPWAVRVLLPGAYLPEATHNAALANAVAVCIAFWARLSIEPYPGIRSSYVILPTAAAAHGLVLAFFFFSRLPYDRFGFLLGFTLHVIWAYAIYFLVQRRTRLSIGVVPFGEYRRLDSVDSVNWIILPRPSTAELAHCDAVVADFKADLPAEWEAFLADAALEGALIYQVKPLKESLTGRVEVDHLSENSFGSLVPGKGYFHLKSFADRLVALVALPLLMPVMLGAALAIWLDDGGPVLFRQKRVGHRGRLFHVYKFRTMRTQLLPPSDPLEAAMTRKLDSRVTRVGALLRRSRIDELPQVFNILRGEMSWIGPRPEAEVLSRYFEGEIPFYRYRHVVKPGISGWAQVTQGHVTDGAEMREKQNYDFYYIKYFSPWLDVLILFKTVRTMVNGFGAR